MRDAPAYSSDRFPADFVASLLWAAGCGVISAPVIWYCSLAYLWRSYPEHGELNGAAVVAGLLDGALIGLGVFVLTFAVRVYLYERRERQRSDAALKLALDEMTQKSDGR